jgi:hypothetical protein
MHHAILEDLARQERAESKIQKQKRRGRVLGCLGVMLTGLLAIALMLNALAMYVIVDAQVDTRTDSNGRMRVKGTNAEVALAQSGREVPLGLLPFLPIYAPTEALEVAPEFVTIYDGDGISTAHRIASISYAPPSMMRLSMLDGTIVVLHSASHGEVWLSNGTFSHGFCSACSTVQLKSLINGSTGLLAAKAAFDEEVGVMNEVQEALCGAGASVGQVLHMSQMSIDRAEALPAVCSIMPDDEDEDGTGSSRSLRSGNGIWKYKKSLLKSLDTEPYGKYGENWAFQFAKFDVDRDGELTLNEILAYAPFAFAFNEVCDPEDATDLAYLFTCCFYHELAEQHYPYHTINLIEFLMFTSSLDKPSKEYKKWKKTSAAEDPDGKRAFRMKLRQFNKGNYPPSAVECDLNTTAIAEFDVADATRRSLSHSPNCPPSSSGCHPATSTLRLESGQTIRIDDVVVGDRIATPEGFEPVVGRLHANSMEYYRFQTAAGKSMAVSKRHNIFANGVRIAPEKVVIGDMLTTTDGTEAVVKITKGNEAGVYTIITPSGTYFVDGVASTTYVAYIPYTVWRIFADGYIHLRYMLGAPIVASGEGVLPLFAQYEILEILNLPEPLMFSLWPLTLLITVAAELANKLVTSAPAILTTCATATMAHKLVHGSQSGSQK